MTHPAPYGMDLPVPTDLTAEQEASDAALKEVLPVINDDAGLTPDELAAHVAQDAPAQEWTNLPPTPDGLIVRGGEEATEPGWSDPAEPGERPHDLETDA